MQILKQIQIPYSFAKRHGVLLRYEGDQALLCDGKTLRGDCLCRKRVEFWGNLPTINCVAIRNFMPCSVPSYAGDTGESQQVAAGLEDHPDLLSLAIRCLKPKT